MNAIMPPGNPFKAAREKLTRELFAAHSYELEQLSFWKRRRREAALRREVEVRLAKQFPNYPATLGGPVCWGR